MLLWQPRTRDQTLERKTFSELSFLPQLFRLGNLLTYKAKQEDEETRLSVAAKMRSSQQSSVCSLGFPRQIRLEGLRSFGKGRTSQTYSWNLFPGPGMF